MHQRRRLVQVALFRQLCVHTPEVRFDLILVQVHRGRNQVARRFAAQLDDVFAEVSFHWLDANLLKPGVETDFLRNHGLALGDRFRFTVETQTHNEVSRLFGCGCPVHVTTGFNHLLLKGLKVEIQVIQNVVLDVPALVPQALELRQGVSSILALFHEAARHVREGSLQLGVIERARCIFLEIAGSGIH